VQADRRWLLTGLFLTTLATLQLEVLDSRLLSVLTWYHLAFLAVSVAMLGMSAGAVMVYLRAEAFEGDSARRQLVRFGTAFALSIPLSLAFNLYVPIPVLDAATTSDILRLAVSIGVLTLPFFLSGVVVTVALTRILAGIGTLYAFDLLGASLGALAIVPLLAWLDLPSAILLAGALAAAGACSFARVQRAGGARMAAVTAAALVALVGWNLFGSPALGVRYSKGRPLSGERIAFERWNDHSYVVAMRGREGRPFYWGAGRGAEDFREVTVELVIDGEAGTSITQWDGRPESLDWVQYDVTSLPYHLRRGGDAAVIGVGGGRDLLAALWAGSARVVGIELNGIFLDLLRGRARAFAAIVDQPAVELVHDEARSALTRSDERFDVLQMSLIDTWAATGAGAFTLSENGLYTVNAWRVFLERLKPDGIFSVSRWFAPGDVSETHRLVVLAVASLLERGARDPARQLVLVSRGSVATLLVSATPFSEVDLGRVREVAARFGFELRALPGEAPSDPGLRRILASQTPEALAVAARHPHFDFSAPSDERPYFFNILRPGSFALFARGAGAIDGVEGVLAGNLRATLTLLALFGIAAVLVVAILFVPLLWVGRPAMSARSFGLSLLYFSLIGMGFMLIQVPFLQRFAVFLGHPTYTFSVILATMILFAGLGSLWSDRVAILETRLVWAIPLGVACLVVALNATLQGILDAAVELSLPGRCAVVVGCVAPVSTLLGFCFPFGIRLVGGVSQAATAWMWGVNGAAGVLASIAAVGISMWAGIDTSLTIAAIFYALLAAVAVALRRYTSEGTS